MLALHDSWLLSPCPWQGDESIVWNFGGYGGQDKDDTYTWIDHLNSVVPADVGGFGGGGSFGGSRGSLLGGPERSPSTVPGALRLDGTHEGSPSPFDIAAAPGTPSEDSSQACMARAEAARQSCTRAAAMNPNKDAQIIMMRDCQANYELSIARCRSLPVAPGTIPEL